MKLAAFMAVNGLPALRYLTTPDDTERVILNAVATEVSRELERAERRARG